MAIDPVPAKPVAPPVAGPPVAPAAAPVRDAPAADAAPSDTRMRSAPKAVAEPWSAASLAAPLVTTARVLGQATQLLGALRGLPVTDGAPRPAPTPPASGARGRTSDAAMTQLAGALVDRLSRGDYRGMVAALHGQQFSAGDDGFAGRLRGAVDTELTRRDPIDAVRLRRLESGMPPQYAFALDRMAHNPGGVLNPEDVARIATLGRALPGPTLASVFSDVAARNYMNPAAFNAEVGEIDRGYEPLAGSPRVRPDQDLIETDLAGSIPGLRDGAVRDYRTMRSGFFGARDLLDAHGRGDGDGVVDAVERNLRRGALADEYGYLATGSRRQDALMPLQLQQTLGIDGARRVQTLLDPSRTPADRAVRYVEDMMRGHLAGSVTADRLQRSLVNLTAGANPAIAGTDLRGRLPAELLDRLGAATDPVLRASIGELRGNGRVDGPQVAAARVREDVRKLNGDTDAMVAFASRIDGMSEPNRAAARAALSDAELRIAATDYRGLVNGMMLRRVQDALEGRNDPVALYGALMRRAASPDDFVRSLDRTPIEQRADLPQRLARETGTPDAYDRLLAALPADQRLQVRGLVASPRSSDPQEILRVGAELAALREHERPGALGRVFAERFGYTGEVVDRELRDLDLAARRFAATPDGQRTQEQLDELSSAQDRLRRALEINAVERNANAQTASAVAMLAVPLASGALLSAAGVRSAALARAVAYSSAPIDFGVNRSMQGEHYEASDALKDALMNFGFDFGAIRLGQYLTRGSGVVAAAQ